MKEPVPTPDLITLGDLVDDDNFDPLLADKKPSNSFNPSNFESKVSLPRPPSANVATITQVFIV